ncbi:hypothetical protein BJV78DRAFT_443703 [Lactifluus subvellereus]|nr:hypothetical protein BJV78DRAFT_443703 [Lactifluus subvellereus]
MLSLLKANYLLEHARGLPLNYTRYFASNGFKRTRDGPPKPAKATLELAPDTLAASTSRRNSLEEGPPLAVSLNHYFRLPPLPPIDDWLSHFPYATPVVRDRISIRDPASAIRVARSFITSKKTSTGNPKIIIEAFPGALSRAFLTLPPSQLRKLIILEDHEPYLEYLHPLARADPRVKVVPRTGFSWDTYSYLLESGDFDVDIAPWETLHPELHFVTHIPQTIAGEQLVAQLFRCIPEKSWLFNYCFFFFFRPLFDTSHTFQRFSAPPKGAERCKLSVTAEASSEFFLSLPPEKLSPFLDHFHPAATAVRVGAPNSRPEARRRGSPFLAVNVVPHAEQVIDKGKMDQWDYILRRLFVLKSTPLRKAISSLAPGAEVLLETLTNKELPPTERVDIRLMVKHLTLSDWALIARAFDAWPFAPEDLNIDSFVSYDRDQ